MTGSEPVAHPRRQRHLVGDGLAGTLHQQRQRYDMGLTIHYQLATMGDEVHAPAGFLGALKAAMGRAPGGAGTVEAPITGYPNFEHLEAEGQRLLPEQLKAMLKALARSNLLRGDTR